MYTRMTIGNMFVYTSLTSEVIKGHITTESNRGNVNLISNVVRGHLGSLEVTYNHPLMKNLGKQFFHLH